MYNDLPSCMYYMYLKKTDMENIRVSETKKCRAYRDQEN